MMSYGNPDPFGWGECDREATNDDGQHFYGYDDGEGTTTWYDESGGCDCTTDTPEDDDW